LLDRVEDYPGSLTDSSITRFWTRSRFRPLILETLAASA
jgi:hypothetical protein